MNRQLFGLAALYRRRAFCLTAGWTVAGLSLALMGAVAQQPPPAGSPPASQASGTSDKSSQDKKQEKKPDKKPDHSTLRVVPQPRRSATGGQAGAPSGAKPSRGVITITPHGIVPPPGPPGGPGGPPGMPFGRGGNGGAPFFGDQGMNSAPFSFDFHGADIQNVLQFFSKMSGMTITADQTLTGPVTIINPKPVTLDDAFKVLQSVLLVRGFSAVQSGNVLRIIPLDKAVGQTEIVNSGLREGIGQIDPRDQVMTQVIPLENVDADAMARELTPLINKGASLIGSPGTNSLIITDTASNVERFIKLAAALDKTSDKTEMRVYPLKRAEATGIADLINNVYRQITGRGAAGGPVPGGPPGMPMPQPPGIPGMPGAARPAVLAVADTRTNSVLVVASAANQEQIAATIINTLDGDDSNTLQTKIRKLLYADADKVADLVNSTLSNMHGESTSSPNAQNQQRRGGFGGFFGGFGGFGGGGNQNSGSGVTSSDPLAKVVADPRTNSLLITAAADRMVFIDQLVDQLDIKVPVETTTFVIPLKNAQADDVAYALGQAFNTANSNSGYTSNYYFGGGNNNQNNGKRQQIQRRLGGSNNSSNGFGRSVRRGAPPGPPNAPGDDGTGDNSTDNSASASPEGIQGVMTPNGFVPTQTDNSSDSNKKQTRQFFFGGFGRQQGLGQTSSPTYGRGRTGAYVNYLQLQGNVFVTASPGGDSIIVTTTPDNYEAVQQIVAQLDVLPRQVLIEAIVAEISLNNDEKLGFNFTGLIHRLFGSNTTLQTQIGLAPSGASQGTTLDSTQAGFQAVLSGTNYATLLQALSQDSKIRVLSTPRIFTANNQQADFEVTTNQPYISGQVSGNFTTTVANTVQYQQIGLILTVTPRITREGQVTIDVVEEASDLLNYLTLGTGTNSLSAPVFDDRYADTEVTVQDGQTVVVGGLIQERHETDITKIPLLSDIPLIGQFFRGREKKHDREELMIFLTPHVVNTIEQETDLTRAQSATIGRDMPEVKNEIPEYKNKNTGRSVQPNPQTPAQPNNGGQQTPPGQTPPGSGG